MTARPKQNEPALKAEAVAALAAECAAWGNDLTADGWIKALERCSLSQNGYELAKDLERYNGVWGIGIDLDLVEILDGASHHLWSAHNKAVKAWIAENNPQPSLPVGHRAAYNGKNGTITFADMNRAVYYFVPDDEAEKFVRGGGILVDFEVLEQVAA